MACGLAIPSVLDALPPAQTPVIWALLERWHYLPLPPPRSAAPEKPLPSAHSETVWQRLAPRLLTAALTLALLAAAGLALARWQPEPPPVFLPAGAGLTASPGIAATLLPAARPSATLPPRPTESHGGHIYFTCTRGDYNQLCVINADGSGYNQLTTGPAHNYYPAVSPLGGMLVYASNRNGLFDLYLLFFQSGNLIQLTREIGNVVSPDFAPDGSTLVFANRAAEGPTSIWMVDKGGLNPRMVYAGPNTIVATAWSPDGETIAFAMSVDLPTEYQIFLMDVNGQNVRQVSHGLQGVGGSLDWSPDGKSLLIYAGPVGDKDVFQLDVATGLTTQLTHGGNNAASSYSPNGEFIVFNSLRNNDQADLFIMRSDGSEERQLTDNPEPDWQPRWEP